MPRFYLIVNERYYPATGLYDYVGHYETAEEAVAAGKKWWHGDWWTVFIVNEDGDLRVVDSGKVNDR